MKVQRAPSVFGGDDLTGYTHLCLDGNEHGRIVYNGNYFCERIHSGCGWALPAWEDTNDPRQNAAIDRLVKKLSHGLALNREGQYRNMGMIRLTRYTR